MRITFWVLSAAAVAAGVGCQLLVDTSHDDLSTGSDASVFDSAIDADGRDAAGRDAGQRADARRPVDAAALALPYRKAVMKDQPVAYFALDEAAGATEIEDLTGGASAYVAGTTPLLGTAGVVGSAAGFDLNGGHISAGDRLEYFDDRPFSIEYWSRPKLIGEKYISPVSKFVPQDNGYSTFFHRSGATLSIMFFVGSPLGRDLAYLDFTLDAGVPDTDTDAPYGDWFYVVGVFDGTIRLFVNGAISAQATANHHPVDTDSYFNIGAYFSGLVDEVAVYDKALTQAQVLAHYQAR